MASAQFDGKHAKQSTKSGAHAVIIHCHEEKREEIRHSNPDIDVSRTHENYQMEGRTLEQDLEFYDARLEEVLSASPLSRPNQNIFRAFTIPAPTYFDAETGERRYLTPEEEKAFFEKAYEAVKTVFGEKNIVNGYVHRDEIHDYIDAATGEKRTSVAHMQIAAVPAVDYKLERKLTEEQKEARKKEKAEFEKRGEKWTSNKSKIRPKAKAVQLDHPRIDCKTFNDIRHIRKINRELDKICQDLFGFSYQNGKEALNMSQNVLKAQSRILAQATQEIETAKTNAIHEAQTEAETIRNKAEAKATTVVNNAQTKAEAIVNKAQKQANAEAETIKNNARTEAETEAEAIRSKAQTEAEAIVSNAQKKADKIASEASEAAQNLENVKAVTGRQERFIETLKERTEELKAECEGYVQTEKEYRAKRRKLDKRDADVKAREAAVEKREQEVEQREQNLEKQKQDFEKQIEARQQILDMHRDRFERDKKAYRMTLDEEDRDEFDETYEANQAALDADREAAIEQAAEEQRKQEAAAWEQQLKEIQDGFAAHKPKPVTIGQREDEDEPEF